MTLGRLPRLFVLVLALLVGLVGFVPAAGAAKAKPTASARSNHKTITLGKTIALKGKVSPSLKGKRVTVQQRTGGSWRTLKKVKLSKKSTYSLRIKPGSTGTKKYRVRVNATKNTKRTFSKVVTVTVKAKKRATGSSCTPGYSPCIPPASDVDCAGGSGNGPAYVQGPVYVTGSDPYDLDRDGDGVGCD